MSLFAGADWSINSMSRLNKYLLNEENFTFSKTKTGICDLIKDTSDV